MKLGKAAFDGDINTLQQLIISGVNVTGILKVSMCVCIALQLYTYTALNS